MSHIRPSPAGKQNTNVKLSTKSFTIRVDRSRECQYKMLVSLGLPNHQTCAALLLKQEGRLVSIEERVKTWVSNNWTQNTELLKIFTEIVKSWERAPHLSFTVNDKQARTALRAVLEFVKENTDTIKQMCSLFSDNCTLAGTQAPPISRVFDKMTYQERQAILRANQRRVEEIPDSDFERL